MELNAFLNKKKKQNVKMVKKKKRVLKTHVAGRQFFSKSKQAICFNK